MPNGYLAERTSRNPAWEHDPVPSRSGFSLPSTRGRLLVAAPPLTDPNFDRTVVFMLDHNEGGALKRVTCSRTIPTICGVRCWRVNVVRWRGWRIVPRIHRRIERMVDRLSVLRRGYARGVLAA
ncbi:MAG: hypothetical protein EBY07_11990 [Actinobacteria bacterium]|nr:hypothetical protein [Actinomycetota bacterium]